MRVGIGLAAAGVVSVCVGGAVWMMGAASPPEKVQPAAVAAIAPANAAPKAESPADVTGTVTAQEPKPVPSLAKRACANPGGVTHSVSLQVQQ